MSARADPAQSDRLNAGEEFRTNPTASHLAPLSKSGRVAPSAKARDGFDPDPIAAISPHDPDAVRPTLRTPAHRSPRTSEKVLALTRPRVIGPTR
jgi:hypothetical protein